MIHQTVAREEYLINRVGGASRVKRGRENGDKEGRRHRMKEAKEGDGVQRERERHTQCED